MPTNSKLALASPYMQAFKGRNGKKDTEVLFMYQNPIDDFVMSNLGTYNNRKLTTAEVGSLDVAKDGSTSGTCSPRGEYARVVWSLRLTV